jgi:hypothetical protein
MGIHPDLRHLIAYETQVRYDADEPWVTISVSRTRLTALEDVVFRGDPWGRVPTEIRIREVNSWPKAA